MFVLVFVFAIVFVFVFVLKRFYPHGLGFAREPPPLPPSVHTPQGLRTVNCNWKTETRRRTKY